MKQKRNTSKKNDGPKSTVISQKGTLSNFKDAIKKSGYTQKALSEKLNITDRTLRKYISGEHTIPPETLTRLEELLMVPKEYILGQTDIPEFGILGLEKELYSHQMTRYRSEYQFFKDLGISFEFKDDGLYFTPNEDLEPIFISDTMFEFFTIHIRKYVREIFNDYYKSGQAFADRRNHIISRLPKEDIANTEHQHKNKKNPN